MLNLLYRKKLKEIIYLHGAYTKWSPLYSLILIANLYSIYNLKNSTCKVLHSIFTFDYISSIYVCHQIYVEKVELKKTLNLKKQL